MKKLLVILGPTATGKTDLALRIAKTFNGELVSCDSRQVYKGLDIGTGKITNNKLLITKGDGFWDVGSVRIWMFDVVNPRIQYSVADYVKKADMVVDDIAVRGKLPIIVGGTGLYLKAVLEGLLNLTTPVDSKLRKKLDRFSLAQLQEKLQEIAPSRWEDLNQSDRHNPRRLVRAIESVLSTNARKVGKVRRIGGLGDEYKILKIGLTAKREILYANVDKSVIKRIKSGMVREVKGLHRRGLSSKRMKELGLEYGVLADYIENESRGVEKLIRTLQGKIHGYVRRQLTWFKKEKEINWFDIGDKNFPKNVEKLIQRWYHQADASSKN